MDETRTQIIEFLRTHGIKIIPKPTFAPMDLAGGTATFAVRK